MAIYYNRNPKTKLVPSQVLLEASRRRQDGIPSTPRYSIRLEEERFLQTAPHVDCEDLSWKVRYRTFLWFFSQMSKLYRARSFSSVSTPNFARKYSLESSWRDLQDLHAFAPLRPQYFRIFSSNFFAFFDKNLQKFVIFEFFHWFLLKFWWKFVGISTIV